MTARISKKSLAVLLAGSVAGFVLLEAGLRLAGWAFMCRRERAHRAILMQEGVTRILCLGESTSMAFPNYLEALLNQSGKPPIFRIINKARPSINSSDILAHVEEQLDRYRPAMVVVMMGINDRSIAYYEELADSESAVFERSRAYRFARLVWMNLSDKLKESRCDIQACIRKGQGYTDRGKYPQAEGMYRKALKLDPRSDQAYVGWARCAECAGRFGDAERLFAKALELDPKNAEAYAGLGRLYQRKGLETRAEEMFRKALALNIGCDSANVELGWMYMNRGRYRQAETTFQRGVSLNPGDERGLRRLAVLHDAAGDHALAARYLERADAIWGGYYNGVTLKNYRRLKGMLDARGAKLVCVQYPMRDVAMLRALFEPEDRKDILFVDNGAPFKKIVKKGGPKDYFMDMFGGDFGHCTPKGDWLLAGNIAAVIFQSMGL